MARVKSVSSRVSSGNRSYLKRMLTDTMSWGEIPQGFIKITDVQGNRFIVRQERAAQIDFSMCRSEAAAAQASEYRGRAPIKAKKLPDGETALIRSYRHGGILRVLTGEWFFTWPPRPFRELTITEELRRRGLRTVEVYAACVSRSLGPFYRGWLVTRELQDAEDLWSALRSDFVSKVGIDAVLRAAADSVRAMHGEGVDHAELNVKNILVRAEDGAVVSYIIDFDRAKLFLGRLPAPLRSKNLARLLRSARKLDPEQKYLSTDAWNRFLAFYDGRPNS